MTSKALTNARALILCAGESARWGGYLGVPKQLIPIRGETLLDRMVRLLRARGVRDIVVVSHDERLRVKDCSILRPDHCRWTVETLLATESLWTDRTVVLLGDVFFTDRAMDSVVATSASGLAIHGRPGASRYTLALHGEIFAVTFDHSNAARVRKHAELAVQHAAGGGRGKLWELYRSLAGFPLDEHRMEDELFAVIDDLTDDLDDPAAYHRLVGRYRGITSSNPCVRSWTYGWVRCGALLRCGAERLAGARRRIHECTVGRSRSGGSDAT